MLDDAQTFEHRVHAALAAYRILGSEHFRLDVATASQRIEAMLANAGIPAMRRPAWADTATYFLPLVLSAFPAGRRLQRQLRRLHALYR